MGKQEKKTSIKGKRGPNRLPQPAAASTSYMERVIEFEWLALANNPRLLQPPLVSLKSAFSPSKVKARRLTGHRETHCASAPKETTDEVTLINNPDSK